MKILFTGGGTGGHFYPIIAVIESIEKITSERRLIPPNFYYSGPEPYDQKALDDHEVTFIHVPAGKRHENSPIKNLSGSIKTFIGIIKAVISLYRIYPDVVFSKGGFASFPTLFAARLLRIPVIIHESDTVPGRVNKWASKFATRIGVSFPESAEFFKKEKVAVTGTPVRRELMKIQDEGALDFFHLEPGLPTVLIIGGSQGAKIINETVLDALPILLQNFQIIHQTGKANFEEVRRTSEAILSENTLKNRYHPEGFLAPLSLRMAAGISKVIVTRAGASALAEIAVWGVPAIVIPITDSAQDHQRKNAFSYARSGAGTVMEERNFAPNILIGEITRIINEKERWEKMSKGAEAFARKDAGDLLATEILSIGLSHDK